MNTFSAAHDLVITIKLTGTSDLDIVQVQVFFLEYTTLIWTGQN